MGPWMKSITSQRDLAINGAPPAFGEPIHVGRPNMGSQEQFFELARGVFERKWLTNNGPLVQQLERQVAEHCGVAHCVAMCNGTVALEVAIRAVELTGEVIVPSLTFIATAHALHWQGLTPVFADVDPTTHNLDPEAVRRRLTPRTSGIIGVHLWGRPAPVAALERIAAEHDLRLLFDSAHAFGCTHRGRQIGGFGRAEVLSFHATKAFNTFEGGAVVTNDTTLAERMRLMRNFGFSGYDNVVHPGTNGKMPEICAAMGLVNLANLPAVVDANRRNYAAYREALAGVAGVELLGFDEREENNYQYVVLELDTAHAACRDSVIAALHAENVLARKYFWPGCHRMLPYRELFPDAGRHLPVTEAIADRIVVLPTGTAVDAVACRVIGDVVRAVLAP